MSFIILLATYVVGFIQAAYLLAALAIRPSTWSIANASLGRRALLERRRARQIARNNYELNMASSALYCLPQELLDEITNRLTIIDMMSLRAACRRDLHGDAHTYLEDRRALRTRLERDFLTRFIEMEAETGMHKIHRPFCNTCFQQHPRSSFTEPQIQMATTTRACIAASASVRFCEHTNLTRSQIRAMARGGSRASILKCCTYTAHNKWREIPTLRRPGGHYQIQKILALINRPDATHVHAFDIHTALAKKDQYICPRLTTANPETSKALFRRFSKQDIITGFFDMATVKFTFDGGSEELYGSCEHKHCKTVFGVLRGFAGGMELIIRRDLGDLRSLSNPEWLAQIDVESK
ncbi:hypothetical protein FB567DRAFT_76479 [Paraphoma chrysanthemicola]|uniref:F-box domain-containing protein n=1 Tax=Paraphoma chrysanthemicola TaxID=798071 RepID=A0A8K0R512_9PLEO|nr:hypothetical protein FB567DRAFT_76479 [Paraphoma chrysanthemicola]